MHTNIILITWKICAYQQLQMFARTNFLFIKTIMFYICIYSFWYAFIRSESYTILVNIHKCYKCSPKRTLVNIYNFWWILIDLLESGNKYFLHYTKMSEVKIKFTNQADFWTERCHSSSFVLVNVSERFTSTFTSSVSTFFQSCLLKNH